MPRVGANKKGHVEPLGPTAAAWLKTIRLRIIKLFSAKGASLPPHTVLHLPSFNLQQGRGIFVVRVKLLSITLALCAAAVPAYAQAVIQHYQLNIPRQPLDTALAEFARQTGLQIARFSDTIDGTSMVGPISGDLSPQQALSCLLAPSGLAFKMINERTIAVVKPESEHPALRPTNGPEPTAAVRALDFSATPDYGTASKVGLSHGIRLAYAESVPSSSNEQQLEEVEVTGRRVSETSMAIGTDATRNTVGITRAALLSAPPGISGLKVLETLPGFNVQANDVLGLYEFGNSVQVRAFTLPQIGFVLDGVPLGRSDAFGGSPIYRYVDNENLERVAASQGAGDVLAPSYATLGPVVNYYSVQPSKALGATLSDSRGSDSLRRTFIKVESGEHAGFSSYASRSKIDGVLGSSPGTINREHIEAKIRYGFGRGDVTAGFVHNHFHDYDSPFIVKGQSRYTSYLATVPALEPTVAGIPYSNPEYANYYGLQVNHRSDYLYNFTGHVDVSASVKLLLTGYYEDKGGYGVSSEDYATALDNYNSEKDVISGLVAPRGVEYGLSTLGGERRGAVLGGSFELANQLFEAMVWLEHDSYHRTQARYNLTGGAPDGTPLYGEPVYLRRDYRSERRTTQVSLKDTISLANDKLKLELGVKALNLNYELAGARNLTDYVSGVRPSMTAHWQDRLLPQLGVAYSLSRHEQLFTSYAESLALPQGADDIFTAATSVNVPAPAAERAQNVELGIRTSRPTFNGVAAIYYTRFKNRLEPVVALIPGTTQIDYFYENVGAVKARGLELSATWKPQFLAGRVYFNNNVTFNKATYENDYDTATGLVASGGKRLADSPEWIIQSGVTYEPVSWAVVNVSAKHVGQRFSTSTDSESIGGFTTFSAYLDIGDGFSWGPLTNAKIRINADNIFDKNYLGTILPVTPDFAVYRPGSHRTVQVSLTAAF
jgi:iron complex outermembrane receptor protein